MGNGVEIGLLTNSSINRYLLSTTYVPGTGLDSGDGRMDKAVFNLM